MQQTSSLNVEYFLKKLERLFFMPTINVFSVMSVSVTVALTIERFLFMKFPMRASSYCTKSNARRTIAILFTLIFMFRLPMYFFSDAEIQVSSNYSTNSPFTNSSLVVTKRVIVVKKHEEYHQMYFTVSLTIFEIIPFFLLSMLNLSIIVLLKKSNQKFDTLFGNQTVAMTTEEPARPRSISTRFIWRRKRSGKKTLSSWLVSWSLSCRLLF